MFVEYRGVGSCRFVLRLLPTLLLCLLRVSVNTKGPENKRLLCICLQSTQIATKNEEHHYNSLYAAGIDRSYQRIIVPNSEKLCEGHNLFRKA
eukprot:scaffold14022_cov146-Skeletonema_dohrnii-CCMP3373.AAC.1